MSRVKRGVTTRRRHKKVLAQTKGFRGRASTCFRVAIRKLHKAWQYAYKHRKVKKADFRQLWIQRINAAVRLHGLTYSKFMYNLKQSNIKLNRKILADMAVRNKPEFEKLIDMTRKAS